ncbi:hypothetical protein V8E51_003225 [Hyaloscypha variabilis]
MKQVCRTIFMFTYWPYRHPAALLLLIQTWRLVRESAVCWAPELSSNWWPKLAVKSVSVASRSKGGKWNNGMMNKKARRRVDRLSCPRSIPIGWWSGLLEVPGKPSPFGALNDTGVSLAGDAAAEGRTSIEHERASLLDIWETNVADADLFTAPTRLNSPTVVDS